MTNLLNPDISVWKNVQRHPEVLLYTEGDASSRPHQSLPIECAVNMLLARVAFDILRSPDAKKGLIAHIHKKMNELRFPDYIHGIEVNIYHSAYSAVG